MDTKTKPFTSYKEIEVHELKLRLRSETQKLRFENHWRALADRDVRSTLFKGAVKDAVSDMRPVQRIAEMMTSGSVATQLVMGLITRRGGIMRRVLGTVAAVVVPNLLAKLPWGKVTGTPTDETRANGHVTHEAQVS